MIKITCTVFSALKFAGSIMTVIMVLVTVGIVRDTDNHEICEYDKIDRKDEVVIILCGHTILSGSVSSLLAWSYMGSERTERNS